MCSNAGLVDGHEHVAGILGDCARGSAVYNSYNIGHVKGEAKTGGIIGRTYYSAGSVKNSYNIGKIECETDCGGIIGKNESPDKVPTITNSAYLTGTAIKDIGNLDENSCEKDEDYIKNSFINIVDEKDIWVINAQKNNGYPIIEKTESLGKK